MQALGGLQAASRASSCAGPPHDGSGPCPSCREPVKRAWEVPTHPSRDGTPPMMPGGLPTAARGGVVRRRLGWWLLVAVLAAGCTTSDATQRPGSDHTDVWFAQHIIPHYSRTAPSSTWPASSSPGPSWPGWPARSTVRAMSISSSFRVGWRAGGWRPTTPAGPRPPQRDRPVTAVQDPRGRVRPRLPQGHAGPATDRPAHGRGRGSRRRHSRAPRAGSADDDRAVGPDRAADGLAGRLSWFAAELTGYDPRLLDRDGCAGGVPWPGGVAAGTGGAWLKSSAPPPSIGPWPRSGPARIGRSCSPWPGPRNATPPTGRPSSTRPSGPVASPAGGAGCWVGWPAGSAPWSSSGWSSGPRPAATTTATRGDRGHGRR